MTFAEQIRAKIRNAQLKPVAAPLGLEKLSEETSHPAGPTKRPYQWRGTPLEADPAEAKRNKRRFYRRLRGISMDKKGPVRRMNFPDTPAGTRAYRTALSAAHRKHRNHENC